MGCPAAGCCTEYTMPSADSFLPSDHGFPFTNSWPSQPAVALATPFGQINVGDASAGLCGGMVFAAFDYWHSSIPPPGDRPDADHPLYRYIVRRLVDSWHLPTGVTQYYQWMNLPDSDSGFTVLGRRVVTDRGVAWRTIRVQWPQIRSDLDHGTPVALGVVTVASANPIDLGQNHQILAYDYEKTGDRVSLRVYDPNQGARDDVEILFDTGDPTRPTTFEHNLGLTHPIRGFFRSAYAPVRPPF
jgi:hypothetical protein